MSAPSASTQVNNVCADGAELWNPEPQTSSPALF